MYTCVVHLCTHALCTFLSPAGVLVAKSSLFSRHSPSASGGGSVLFVSVILDCVCSRFLVECLSFVVMSSAL